MICSTILIVIMYLNFVSLTMVDNSTEYDERIAWGQWVHELGAHQYFVSIQIKNEDWTPESTHNCGGAFITRNLIVTAAHCFDNATLVPHLIVLPNYRNTPFVEENDLIFKISRYVIHPGYDINLGTLTQHDIAVVLLDRPDPRPIETLKFLYHRLDPCTPVKMMGFGLIEGDIRPARLRDATVFIIPNEVCQLLAPYSPSQTICTGSTLSSAGCAGDSGGPLVWENPENRNKYIIGVLNNAAIRCGTSAYTVFADVYAHTQFCAYAIYHLYRDELRSEQSAHVKPQMDLNDLNMLNEMIDYLNKNKNELSYL